MCGLLLATGCMGRCSDVHELERSVGAVRSEPSDGALELDNT